MIILLIRKKEIMTAAMIVAIVSAVITVTSYTATYMEGIQNLTISMLNYNKYKLIPTTLCENTTCVEMCETTIAYSNISITVPAIFINKSNKIEFKGFINMVSGQTKEGSIIMGYLLADELGVGPGSRVSTSIGGQLVNHIITGVYRSRSILDYGVIVIGQPPRGEVKCIHYTLRSWSPAPIETALRGEVLNLLEYWRLAFIFIFIIATLLVTLDSVGKLEREGRLLKYEGGREIMLVYELALFMGLSAASGFALGIVVGDVVLDVVSTLAETPVVRQELPWRLVIEGVVVRPVIASLASLLLGVLAWQRSH